MFLLCYSLPEAVFIHNSPSACTKRVSSSRNLSRWSSAEAGMGLCMAVRAEQRGVHCSIPFCLLCIGLIQCSTLLLWHQNLMMQAGDIHLEYHWSLNKQYFLGYDNAGTLLCNLGVLAKMSAGAFKVPLWTEKKIFPWCLANREQAILTELGVQLCFGKKVDQKTYYADTFLMVKIFPSRGCVFIFYRSLLRSYPDFPYSFALARW